MNVQFIGATGTVTGSKYLISLDKKKFLVDCGLFQGLKELRIRNWSKFPVDPKSIEAVILTHAHIDHSGYLPLLIKNGFRGKVYATSATRRLCQILLPDSGHLQEEDAFFANKHQLSKHKPALPLYTEEDARESLKYFESVPWNKHVSMGRHMRFRYIFAGHILGAAMVEIEFPGGRLLFSGDLGRLHNIVMSPPAFMRQADYLVVESTYGDRLHPAEDPMDAFRVMIDRTIKRGGIVLIPAFAVGRAQEVLYLLSRLKREKKLPDVPVYLNSPMAIEATQLFKEFPDEHALSSGECELMCDVAKFVTTVEESKQLNGLNEPSIIISASGMLTGGRVLHHLKFLAPDPRNLILFVGFQAAGTRGEAMLEGKDHIKIHGLEVPVKAEIQSIETLSAHADVGDIVTWLHAFDRPPKMTFITHGEPHASEALRLKIDEELAWPSRIPQYLETVDLR